MHQMERNTIMMFNEMFFFHKKTGADMSQGVLKDLNKMPKFQEKLNWALEHHLGIKR